MKGPQCRSIRQLIHKRSEFLPCSRGFVLRMTHESMWWSLKCRNAFHRKLPMVACGPAEPENPDFHIKIEIFHSSSCDAYFRDLFTYFECTHAQSCYYPRWAKTKGVVHLHSDARKCAKKNKTGSQKNHILVHFER